MRRRALRAALRTSCPSVNPGRVGLARANASTKPASRVRTLTAGEVAAPLKSPITTAGRTIFVDTACTSTSGDGTQANPYCSVQAAVDAAVAGDTVRIAYSAFSTSRESVTVRTSGISLVGVGNAAWIFPANDSAGKPALVLDGVSDVTVSNLMLQSRIGSTA